MSKKERIPVNQAASTPLNNPFASLAATGLPAGKEISPAQAPPAPKRRLGRVVLRKETAHRGGKTVIVVDDFETHLPLSYIEDLARQLRNACGCGGTTHGRSIELQGNQPARIRALLEAEGFKVAGIS